MNILFVTFGELSVGGGNPRSYSILRALLDAGHKVDLIAARTSLPERNNLNLLVESDRHEIPRRHLKWRAFKATGMCDYDVVHAIDESALLLYRICLFRKLKLVYDATRVFSGTEGMAPSRIWKLFPRKLGALELNMLSYASVVLAPCSTLKTDLTGVAQEAAVFQLEDVPVQPLLSCIEPDRRELDRKLDGPSSAVVVCCILPDNTANLKKLMMAARKVVDAIPAAAFFFKGINSPAAEAMATNLDIVGRSVFLAPEDTVEYATALHHADATLLIAAPDSRYMHPEVFTLLNTQAPLVVVQEGAYDAVLNDENSVPVLMSAESIAEGLLRVIQEPLFSVRIATEGQQLVADNYSLSSFKHKVRMIYHEVLNRE